MADLVGNRYELERRLGHGGMATVHCAHDRKLDRQVAIKLLADNLVDDDVIRKRFMREARLAAKLDHPNVVQVFDVGEDEGRPYIVMEYLDGGTLEGQLQRRKGLSQTEALGFLGQMCAGLGHAHRRKLVHRDVKPQNLLLRKSDDCLKIADFGIARVAEETTRLTQPGKVIGTDSYMAPEQLADGKITAATDVYACGVVADQAMPGARPPEMRAIIDRCLREDPRERFRDANALGTALKGVNGEPTATAVRPARSARTPRRHERSTVFVPRTRDGDLGTRRRFPDFEAGSRMALALIVGAIVVVAIVIAASSGGGSSSSSPAPSGVSGPGSIQQSGDAARQARALADYLRQQAR